MPIEHNCPCGAKLKVKDEMAGKRIKCPKCSQASTVVQAKIQPEMIPVKCSCGKSFQAKGSMPGKSFKCTACEEMVKIPGLNEPVQAKLESFGDNASASNTASLFDESFPDLGIPTAAHVPYQAPVNATVKKKETSEKRTGVTLNFNQDTLVIITAILCILFGLSRLVFLNPVFLLWSPKALFSFGGLIYLANTLVCIGILAAGIGLLFEQEWSITVGQIAASMYFVIVFINIVIFLGNLGDLLDGRMSVTALTRSISLFVGELTGSSVVPGLLLYITMRNNG